MGIAAKQVLSHQAYIVNWFLDGNQAWSYQAIAQRHQGSIHVHSQLGKGSTFIVRLPLNHEVSA
ncbi:ATP-binding protein [Phormidesmis priestleyi]|uniref:ATP-binding protein n=1 Tax=Phormidesmis priestleyi TaxID=268141 RepID=UPI00094318E2|nr:ATP-binding protein [Phormidesmis priestleyi]